MQPMLQLYFAPGACSFVPHVGLEAIKAAGILREKYNVAADLWSVLYLQPARTPGVLSAQAEYQARILPALAGQLAAETSRCTHTRPASGHTRSTP